MGKYDEYFIQYGITTPKIETELRPVIARVDDTVAKGSFFYLVHWMYPFDPGTSFFSGVTRQNDQWKDQHRIIIILNAMHLA